MAFLERNANRGSISTGPYQIDNSCKFEADNTEYLERDPSSAGDRQKFTTSMWVKRTELGQASTIFGVYPTSSVGDTTVMQFGFMSTDKFQLGLQTYYVFNTARLFRDTSAWYHIVVAFDTTQGTAANRIKLYVNGIQETAFDVEAYPNQNHTTGVNFTEPHRIGTLISNSWYFSGYIAEVNHVDGSQLAPTDFGEVDDDSGIWIPKAYTGSYGTNGFYLDFADAANLGNDASGGTDFTKTNIAASDQGTDTPTNNFCTLALQVRAGTSSEIGPVREGGTYMKQDGVNQYVGFFGTIGVTQGKWYWEVYVPSRSASYGLVDYIGLHSMKTIPVGGAATGGTSQCNYVLHYGDYNATVNGTNSGQNTAAGLPSYGTDGAGKTFGIAFNADDGQITYYANNTRIGNAGIDIFDLHDDMVAGTFVHPFIQVYDNNLYVNFGGCSFWASPSDYDKTDANDYGSFAYAPPSGYYALCTKNLAEFGG